MSSSISRYRPNSVPRSLVCRKDMTPAEHEMYPLASRTRSASFRSNMLQIRSNFRRSSSMLRIRSFVRGTFFFRFVREEPEKPKRNKSEKASSFNMVRYTAKRTVVKTGDLSSSGGSMGLCEFPPKIGKCGRKFAFSNNLVCAR